MISRKALDAALERKGYRPDRRKKLVKDLLAIDSGLVIEETDDPSMPKIDFTVPATNGDQVRVKITGYTEGMSALTAMLRTGQIDTLDQVAAQFAASGDTSMNQLVELAEQSGRADIAVPPTVQAEK